MHTHDFVRIFRHKISRQFPINIIPCIIALLFSFAAQSASAAQIGIDFYFDTDANASTGCSVTLLTKTIAGFERKVSIVYDDSAQTVTSGTVAQCLNGVLQAPTALNTSLWHVATDSGNPAQDILSGTFPASLFPTQPTGVVVTSADGGTVVDVLDGGNPGFASLAALSSDGSPTPIPTLDIYGLFALIIAIMGMSWYMNRRQGSTVDQGRLQSVVSALLVGSLMAGSVNKAEAASSVVITEPTAQATSELSSIQKGDILSTEFQKNGNGDIGVRVTVRRPESAITLPTIGRNSATEFVNTPSGPISMGRLLVYKYARVTNAEAITFLVQRGLEIVGSNGRGTFEVRAPAAQSYEELRTLKQNLETSGATLFFQVDYLRMAQPFAWSANDPALTIADQRWGFESIKAPNAWQIISALPQTTVAVGLADLGFRANDTVPDLTLTTLNDSATFWNCVSYWKDNDEFCTKHGYHVAGTMGATANNGIETVGVGSAVNPLRIHARGGVGQNSAWDNVIEIMNISRAVNLSMGNGAIPNGGSGVLTAEQEQQIRDSRTRYAAIPQVWRETVVPFQASGWELNTLIVQASGNGGGWRRYSSSSHVSAEDNGLFCALGDSAIDSLTRDVLLPHIMIVGSHGPWRQDQFNRWSRPVSPFTQLPETSAIRNVFILAPGENIYSTVQSGLVSNSGTSMAAPHVTGTAALVKQANGNITAHELQQIILGSADNEDGTTWIDDSDGWRYLNAEMAVRNARGPLITSASVISGGTVGVSTGVKLYIDSTRAGATKVEIDPGDGTGWTTAFSGRAIMPVTQFTATHTYTSSGTKSAYLRVTDILERQAVYQIPIPIAGAPLCSAGVVVGSTTDQASVSPYLIGASGVTKCQHGSSYLGFSASANYLYIHADDVTDTTNIDPYLYKSGSGLNDWATHGLEDYFTMFIDVGMDGVDAQNVDYGFLALNDAGTVRTPPSNCQMWFPSGWFPLPTSNQPVGTTYYDAMLISKFVSGGNGIKATLTSTCVPNSKYWRLFDVSSANSTSHRQHVIALPRNLLGLSPSKQMKAAIETRSSHTVSKVSGAFLLSLP